MDPFDLLIGHSQNILRSKLHKGGLNYKPITSNNMTSFMIWNLSLKNDRKNFLRCFVNVDRDEDEERKFSSRFSFHVGAGGAKTFVRKTNVRIGRTEKVGILADLSL